MQRPVNNTLRGVLYMFDAVFYAVRPEAKQGPTGQATVRVQLQKKKRTRLW
jgi:hypothetical protein